MTSTLSIFASQIGDHMWCLLGGPVPVAKKFAIRGIQKLIGSWSRWGNNSLVPGQAVNG